MASRKPSDSPSPVSHPFAQFANLGLHYIDPPSQSRFQPSPAGQHQTRKRNAHGSNGHDFSAHASSIPLFPHFPTLPDHEQHRAERFSGQVVGVRCREKGSRVPCVPSARGQSYRFFRFIRFLRKSRKAGNTRFCAKKARKMKDWREQAVPEDTDGGMVFRRGFPPESGDTLSHNWVMLGALIAGKHRGPQSTRTVHPCFDDAA